MPEPTLDWGAWESWSVGVTPKGNLRPADLLCFLGTLAGGAPTRLPGDKFVEAIPFSSDLLVFMLPKGQPAPQRKLRY